ncbi:MAG: hypothetical protein FH751_09080 [Firmicutes bacterium]|nr:hypothetical protein [Bacillota bacterium]
MKNKKEVFIFIILLVSFLVAVFVSKLIDNLLLVGLFIVLYTFLINFILKGMFKYFLRNITNYIKKINKNDLTSNIENESGMAKEILSEIGKVIKGLKNNFRQQVNISTEITKLSNELQTIAEESKASMDKITSSTETTSNNSEQQSQMLQNITDNVEDIVKTLETTNEEMNETVNFTETSIKSAQQGIRDTDQIKLKMEEIKNIVNNTEEKVKALNDYSKEVSKFIDLINQIAEQTNMLALNASIEASRAGEYGKGFAVVANEVGTLSKETTEVSNKIGEVIKTLQNEIVNITESMEKESIYVDEGYTIVNETISKFNSIDDSLKACVDKVKSVDKDLEDVNYKGQDIMSGIEEITAFSEEIASEMQEMEAESNLQDEKASKIKEITENLNIHADKMQQYVTSKVMEGKMLKDVYYIKDELKNKNLDNNTLNKLLEETGVDLIYVTDDKGTVTHCNEKDSIGLNLYEVDESFEDLRNGNKKYVATPVKKRAEDGKVFKFLAVIDEDKIYQVGLSIKTLLKF